MPDASGENGLRRFLGGSPLSILVRLLFLSLIVGAFMALLGTDPLSMLYGFTDLVRRVFADGIAVLGTVGVWLVTGALLVVPIFLIVRLVRSLR